MQPLDAVYLQILKNLCTDLSEPEIGRAHV